MILQQLTEAKYRQPKQKAQFRNLSVEQIIDKFFVLDDEMTQDDAATSTKRRYYYPRRGLHVEDDRGSQIPHIIFYPINGKFYAVDLEAYSDWEFDPSKIKVYTTQLLYEP